jgi:hypothetical protein
MNNKLNTTEYNIIYNISRRIYSPSDKDDVYKFRWRTLAKHSYIKLQNAFFEFAVPFISFYMRAEVLHRLLRSAALKSFMASRNLFECFYESANSSPVITRRQSQFLYGYSTVH